MNKGKINRKFGRNKEGCTRYRLNRMREKNKLKRILKNKCNSYEDAVKYANLHNIPLPKEKINE